MRRFLRLGVLRALAFLVVLAPGASAEPPTTVKVAQDLARAHAAWPAGREWLSLNRPNTDRLVVRVLNRCLPDAPDGELTAFSIYVRLSEKGKVLEVVTEIDAALGRCMTTEAREVQLPEAPRNDFWIQLNLAATL